MSDRVRIVLVNTSHPGNIGASARAMKTMGLSQLVLVSPKEFPHHAATARAAGADEVLAQATVVADLASAIADCELVFATSARARHLPWPLVNPRECVAQVMQRPHCKIAWVFGNERVGLSNEELAQCHYHVRIPTVNDYHSLNLAAAVQVLAYEWRMAQPTTEPVVPEVTEPLATMAELAGLYHHFESALIAAQFLDPTTPKFLMHRLKRLFNRAQLEREELNLLRGMLNAFTKIKEPA